MSARNAPEAILEFEKLQRLMNGDNPMPRWYLESRHKISESGRISPELTMEAEKYLWRRLRLETNLCSEVPGIPMPETAEAEGLEIFASETRNCLEKFADIGYVPETLTLETLQSPANPGTIFPHDVPSFT